MMTAAVNFTNILQAAFARKQSRTAKKHRYIKAACEMSVKSTNISRLFLEHRLRSFFWRTYISIWQTAIKVGKQTIAFGKKA